MFMAQTDCNECSSMTSCRVMFYAAKNAYGDVRMGNDVAIGFHHDITMHSHIYMQSVPLATSPKPLSNKYSFGLVKIIHIQYIL